MSPPLNTTGRSANRQCFERNAWCTRAQLRYVVSHTSFGVGWEVITQTDGVYEIPYVIPGRLVVWSTAISIYLPVLPCYISIGSNVRFYPHDFHGADVGY